jgi:hypothetical protein
MPNVAVAVFDPSARLVAVIVTTPAVAGAVNVTALPEVLVVGENEPPPVDDQITPWFVVSLVSVAPSFVNFCEVVRPPRRGDTLTVMLDPPEEDVVADAVLE